MSKGGVDELALELAKLRKINGVLIRQVERLLDSQGSDFTTFHRAVLLEQEVQNRTRDLERSNSQLQSALKALEASERRFRRLIDDSIQGVVIHRSLMPLYVNQAYAFMQGYPAAESLIAAGSLEAHIVAEDLARVRAVNAACQAGELESHTYEYQGYDGEGRRVWREARCARVEWQGEAATQLVVIDITERKERESRLFYQANYDMLTGLPNRALLFDRMQQLTLRMARERLNVAVLFIDLDGFKGVNDALGHALGDQVLCQAAQRLAGALRAGDTVARLGGDEFIALLCDVDNERDLEAILDKLHESLRVPFLLEAGQGAKISASIGVAWASCDLSRDQVLRDADAAMYQAKLAGRDRHVIWRPGETDEPC